MLKKITILDTGYDSYEYEHKLFTEAGYQLDIFQGKRHDRSGKIKFSKDATGILLRWTVIDDEFLRETPHLKAIARYGAGYENIDLKAVSRFNVKVSNVQGYANHSVSDHTIAMMYACARALIRGQKIIKDRFGVPPIKEVFEFRNKTLGIIGLGRIGGTLCVKIGPLFKKVLATDPYILDKRFKLLGAEKSSLKNLLRNSNVISIHCNLSDETTSLINKQTIKLMDKTPILINTSRGAVINEDDLYEALQAGAFHSVALDVYCNEPPLANRDELLSHPRVIATGHYAWYSMGASVEVQKRAADNLLAMLQGKIPEDCLNP